MPQFLETRYNATVSSDHGHLLALPVCAGEPDFSILYLGALAINNMGGGYTFPPDHRRRWRCSL